MPNDQPLEPATLAPRTTLYRYADLARVLAPSSVAIIGASPWAGSFGALLRGNLRAFGGPVYLINPRYQEIDGERCYGSVAALPEVPECVVLTVGREAVEQAVTECADAGVPGVVVFASGYSETGKPERLAEQTRLSMIARHRNIRIIGPNTIGIANFINRLMLSFGHGPSRTDIQPHSVGVASQSGALGFALSQSLERGLSISHILTSGNSCDVDVADYVAFLAEEPSCRAIACVFEGMANPHRLLEAADLAWEVNKPLVIYKMASGALGAAAALSHTGSLAGSETAYGAAFA